MATSIAAEIRSNLSSIWYLSIIEKKFWVITLYNYNSNWCADDKDKRDFDPDYPNHDIIESNDSIGITQSEYLG